MVDGLRRSAVAGRYGRRRGELDRAGPAAAAVTLILWSSVFTGIRRGRTAHRRGHRVFPRLLVASAVLAAIAAVRGGLRRPSTEDPWRVGACGPTGITQYHLPPTYGEEWVPADMASPSVAAASVFAAAIGRVTLGERLSARSWTDPRIPFGGAAGITPGDGGEAGFAACGPLVLAPAAWAAAFFVRQKPLVERYNAGSVTAWVTGACTVPVLAYAPGLLPQVAHAPAAVALDVPYVALFPAAVAYVMWSTALARAPASQVAPCLYGNPVLATAIAVVWLGEVPGSGALGSAAVTLGGVILGCTLGPTREAAPPRARGVGVAVRTA